MCSVYVHFLQWTVCIYAVHQLSTLACHHLQLSQPQRKTIWKYNRNKFICVFNFIEFSLTASHQICVFWIVSTFKYYFNLSFIFPIIYLFIYSCAITFNLWWIWAQINKRKSRKKAEYTKLKYFWINAWASTVSYGFIQYVPIGIFLLSEHKLFSETI